jgi:hypothetical protein
MQFESKPTEAYEHGLVLESAKDEVETVAAAYRERIHLKVAEGRLDEIQQHERDFSMWSSTPDRTLLTSRPLSIAHLLESFHGRTKATVEGIFLTNAEPAFESRSIARRMYLGEKAFQLAGLIRLEYDHESINQELDEQGVALFVEEKPAPEATNPDEQ